MSSATFNPSAPSAPLIAEDGSVSSIRRNQETGELYDATGLYNDQGAFIESSSPDASAVEPNPLHEYFTYNYVITFSALNTDELNNASYRGKSPDSFKIIFRTGSGFPENRIFTAQQEYETKVNEETGEEYSIEKAGAISGKFDFFIEDLRIMSALGMDKHAKNTNATGISFKVIEPYSIGLFYQSLQIAARESGFPNFLDAPYLLTIEFIGQLSPDTIGETVPYTTKYISLRILDINMSVTAQGAVYNVQAYPYNELAYSKYFAQLPVDATVRGKTVGELIKGGTKESEKKNLKEIINDRFKKHWEKEKEKPAFADEIDIVFPETADKSDDVNRIFSSKMDYDGVRTSHPGMIKEDQVYDALAGVYNSIKIKADPKLSEFKYAQGSDVINAINQIILLSDYPKWALGQDRKDGMVPWWRIIPITQAEADVREDGVRAKKVILKVVPYYVHISKFSKPNLAMKGKQIAEGKVKREYNYIYTGKNVDIIDFNIMFDYSFYTNLNADYALKGGDQAMQAQQSNAAKDEKIPKDRALSEAGDADKTPDPTMQNRNVLRHYGKGGSVKSYAAQAAEQFHNVVTDMSALMTLDLTILGDPYYLGDSGMGNYYATPTDNKNINVDKSIDYLSGETHVKITFKNPIDPSMATGLYVFPSSEVAKTKVVESISGLYQVFTLESIFSRGKFTQVLNCTKRPGQYTKNPENKIITKPQEFTKANYQGVAKNSEKEG